MVTLLGIRNRRAMEQIDAHPTWRKSTMPIKAIVAVPVEKQRLAASKAEWHEVHDLGQLVHLAARGNGKSEMSAKERCHFQTTLRRECVDPMLMAGRMPSKPRVKEPEILRADRVHSSLVDCSERFRCYDWRTRQPIF